MLLEIDFVGYKFYLLLELSVPAKVGYI